MSLFLFLAKHQVEKQLNDSSEGSQVSDMPGVEERKGIRKRNKEHCFGHLDDLQIHLHSN